jgi:hypothetical protein
VIANPAEPQDPLINYQAANSRLILDDDDSSEAEDEK